MRFAQTLYGAAARRGFSLVEALVAMAVVGVTFTALYSGLTYGFSRVQFSRENQRATQILVEKMETVRLYSWTQLNTPGFVPDTFTATYYPNAGTNESAGVVYSGTLKMADVDLDTNYEDQVKKLTVGLTWYTGHTKRTRELTTYVTEHGLHVHF